MKHLSFVITFTVIFIIFSCQDNDNPETVNNEKGTLQSIIINTVDNTQIKWNYWEHVSDLGDTLKSLSFDTEFSNDITEEERLEKHYYTSDEMNSFVEDSWHDDHNALKDFSDEYNLTFNHIISLEKHHGVDTDIFQSHLETIIEAFQYSTHHDRDLFAKLFIDFFKHSDLDMGEFIVALESGGGSNCFSDAFSFYKVLADAKINFQDWHREMIYLETDTSAVLPINDEQYFIDHLCDLAGLDSTGRADREKQAGWAGVGVSIANIVLANIKCGSGASGVTTYVLNSHDAEPANYFGGQIFYGQPLSSCTKNYISCWIDMWGKLWYYTDEWSYSYHGTYDAQYSGTESTVKDGSYIPTMYMEFDKTGTLPWWAGCGGFTSTIMCGTNDQNVPRVTNISTDPEVYIPAFTIKHEHKVYIIGFIPVQTDIYYERIQGDVGVYGRSYNNIWE